MLGMTAQKFQEPYELMEMALRREFAEAARREVEYVTTRRSKKGKTCELVMQNMKHVFWVT